MLNLFFAFIAFTITSCSETSNHKFKSGDCLFFQNGIKTKEFSHGSILKIIGIAKDNNYIVRSFGGVIYLSGKDILPQVNGWNFISYTQDKTLVEIDGVAVECPKE